MRRWCIYFLTSRTGLYRNEFISVSYYIIAGRALFNRFSPPNGPIISIGPHIPYPAINAHSSPRTARDSPFPPLPQRHSPRASYRLPLHWISARHHPCDTHDKAPQCGRAVYNVRRYRISAGASLQGGAEIYYYVSLGKMQHVCVVVRRQDFNYFTSDSLASVEI